MRMLLHWLANALALFALPYIFTTITVDSFVTALIVALVLALINTLIRPLLVLLTLSDTGGKKLGTGTGFFVSEDGRTTFALV